MDTSLADIIQFISSTASGLTTGALLLLIFYGGFKRWWVFGWVHEDAKASLLEQLSAATIECAEWRAFAMKGTDFAEQLAARPLVTDGDGE